MYLSFLNIWLNTFWNEITDAHGNVCYPPVLLIVGREKTKQTCKKQARESKVPLNWVPKFDNIWFNWFNISCALMQNNFLTIKFLFTWTYKVESNTLYTKSKCFFLLQFFFIHLFHVMFYYQNLTWK